MQGRVTKSSALHFILKNAEVGVCFARLNALQLGELLKIQANSIE